MYSVLFQMVHIIYSYGLATVYVVIFEGRKFRRRQVRKDFRGLIFADHQVEYIVFP